MQNANSSTQASAGYSRNAGKRWRGDEIKQLRDLARRGAPLRLISLKLGRPDAAIRTKARDLGLTIETSDAVVAPAPKRTLSRRPFQMRPSPANDRQLELFGAA
ncbi:MAG: hypothetical protein NXI12_05475 [Alphaproteobacteria bacterium]|nr:hypothetical protein [Alphaproteobacteria bacterium]